MLPSSTAYGLPQSSREFHTYLDITSLPWSLDISRPSPPDCHYYKEFTGGSKRSSLQTFNAFRDTVTVRTVTTSQVRKGIWLQLLHMFETP